MNTIDIFLNELQKRIDNNDTIINNYETKRNELIELQNIFYTHNALNKEVTLDDLLSFSDEEIKVLIKSIDKEKKEMLYRTFMVYKPIVVTYRNISSKFGDFEAPQYQDAQKWLKELLNRVNLYIREFENNNEDYIKLLKEENAYYKKYYNLFNGDKLISPIEDLDEFNKLLEKLDLDVQEIGQIKKQIGLNHIDLLAGNMEPDIKEELVEENKNNEKDIEETSFVTEPSLETEPAPTIELVPISEIAIDESVPEVTSTVAESETITATNKDAKEMEDNPIIEEALEILHNEKEFINSIDEKEFNEYLVKSVVDNSKSNIKYQILSILLALHREVEKYKNVKGTNKTEQVYISNIKEYIETYKALKEKNKKK